MFTVKGVVWPVGRAAKNCLSGTTKPLCLWFFQLSADDRRREWKERDRLGEKKKYIIMRSKYALTDPSHGSHPSTCSRILVPAERLFKLSSHTHEGNTTTPICVKGVYAAGSPGLFLSSLHFPIEEKKRDLFKSIWRKRQKEKKNLNFSDLFFLSIN